MQVGCAGDLSSKTRAPVATHTAPWKALMSSEREAASVCELISRVRLRLSKRTCDTCLALARSTLKSHSWGGGCGCLLWSLVGLCFWGD